MADPLNRGPENGPESGPSILRQELSVILAPRNGLVICALVSATLLVGAFLFEHVGGMAPCSLCIWQRWAHLSVIAAAADLVDQLLATPVVRCDDVPWSLFGLSMAGWNTLFSLDISAVALLSFILGDRVARRT